MYWGQIAVGLASASAVALYLLDRGGETLTAILVATLVYIGVRWLLAWIYRTKFWYKRGRSVGPGHCPDCGQSIHRLGGDWHLECKRCGWREGMPIIRWVSRSVPARQLRRTIIGPHLVIAVIIVAVLASGAASSIALPSLSDDAIDAVGEQNTTPAASGSTTNENGGRGLAKGRVRNVFLAQLNQERADRGLQSLSLRSELTAMGEAHAANMAEHDYVGHDWPDGTTIQDRYWERGLLPECRLDLSGSNGYYAGAENAAGAWIGRQFSSSGGSYYVTSEEDLGRALFNIWLNSPPHRRAMMVYSADEMGLGINVTDRGKVYAALELC